MESAQPAFYQLLVIALFLVPAILFLITQQKTIQLIQPVNRSISPWEVYLQLIPLFGMIWQFVVVSRIASALGRELSGQVFSFEQPGITSAISFAKPTYNFGIAYCVLFSCSIIPLLGLFTALAGLVCWIVYWVQLLQYKRRLEQKFYS